MNERGKLDWSRIRPVDPDEAEKALQTLSKGEMTIRVACQEITEENAWWVYYPRNDN